MSCNIKLAVSESSQLSVNLVVLACQAAHLCLLDKTCSILPRENTLSAFLFFLSPMLSLSLCFCLFLSFLLSVSLTFFLHLNTVSLFIWLFFYFLPFLLLLLHAVLHTQFLSGFLPCFSVSTILFVFPSPSSPLPLSIFILYYFGTFLSALRFKAAPSLWRRCSSLLCTWLSTLTRARTHRR